jgi:hypothetical protein
MLRAHREPHEAEFGQVLADRALVHLDPEQFLDARLQVDPAPAHHAILVDVRSRLDQGDQSLLLLRGQLGGAARRLAVAQSCQPLGVVAVHPIAQGLPIHTAGTGSRGAISALQHQGERQHATSRRDARRLGGGCAQRLSAQISPRDRDPSHGVCS